MGAKIFSGPDSEILVGNCLPIAKIPLGTIIHNIEMKPGKGGQIARTAGAECLRLKGGAGYAVGLAVREVVAAILNDTGAVLPVSTLHASGHFQGVALSLPTRVGRSGVQEVLPLALSEDEHRALSHSAEVLRETIGSLGTEPTA